MQRLGRWVLGLREFSGHAQGIWKPVKDFRQESGRAVFYVLRIMMAALWGNELETRKNRVNEMVMGGYNRPGESCV